MPCIEFPRFHESYIFYRSVVSHPPCDSSRIRRYTWTLDTKEILTFVQ
jgi:hypothetical protein